MCKNAERVKIREYKERILNVEHADFNPLVFTCTGGMAPRCQMVVKRLAEKLSKKQNLQFSVVSVWLCVRATRQKKPVFDNNIELAVSAARMEF